MLKLKKREIPSGHTLHDFKCFGPAATKDGEFTNVKICDMGCFKQDGVDTNKYYFGCITQSKINSEWYCYFEWGKIGGATDFQFYKCESEAEAQKQFEKQLHSKNDKRGEWFDDKVLGKILRAKKGKDCYLVQNKAVRSVGLPDARTIGQTKAVSIKKYEPEVQSLLDDLQLGTLEYTRNSMSSGDIPSLDAIEEARKIITEASKGKNLEDLTSMLYSRIPKRKSKGEDYLLSGDNIKSWLDDLDAFESALDGVGGTVEFPFELEYVTKKNKLYTFVHDYIQNATLNRHSWCSGPMKIKNIWKIVRDSKSFDKYQEKVAKYERDIIEKPFHLDKNKTRPDLDKNLVDLFEKTNTRLMFHGTRSVNVGGILRENLRLPKQLSGVSINGALMGGGLYWADDFKKSIGYSSVPGAYWSKGGGSIPNRLGFMFLCDTVLGEPYLAPRARGYTEPPNGYDCVLAKRDTFVQNSEFITYNTESNQQKYLIEFNM